MARITVHYGGEEEDEYKAGSTGYESERCYVVRAPNGTIWRYPWPNIDFIMEAADEEEE